jgi:hypothetical protein
MLISQREHLSKEIVSEEDYLVFSEKYESFISRGTEIAASWFDIGGH